MKMGGVAVVRETVIMQGGCGGFLSGIERTLRERGTWVQRILCAAMMALLSMAELPGGGYCCQSAMFAVLLRQGSVSPRFCRRNDGICGAVCYGNTGGVLATACLHTALAEAPEHGQTRQGRITMAAAEFAAQLTAAAVTGIGSLYAIAVTVLTAAAGAGLSILYDGAALSVSRRDELDGDTRPLCILAVCASLAVGLASFSEGQIPAAALAMYLTLEHAYIGGGIAGNPLRRHHGRRCFAGAGKPADARDAFSRRIPCWRD